MVKAACESHSKSELTSRNPKISLDRLSPEMVARHGDLFTGQYQVEIKLEYRKPWEEFLNPELFPKEPRQEIPWAPTYVGDNNLRGFYDDQFHNPGIDLLREDIRNEQSRGDLSDWISGAMWATNTAVGAVSTYTVESGKYYKWNEVWHKYKTTTAWRWQANRWNNFGAKARRVEQVKTVVGQRKLAGKLTKAGGVLILADIAFSGEIKPSHAINAAMLGASTTGVGAIVAGIWFIADFGTMGFNYLVNDEAKGIGDMLDESVGTIELYKGIY